MAFRLTTLFYVTALLASALGAFGVGGLFFVGMVVVGGCWARLYQGKGGEGLLPLAIVMTLLLLGGAAWFVLHSLGEAIDDFYAGMESRGKISSLAVGLREWQQPTSSPPHSWRVDLLKNDSNLGALVTANYHFDEAWDSPKNRSLIMAQLSTSYQRPARSGGDKTHYLGVVDPRCAWNASGLMPKEEISDGPENTLLLIETTSSDITWNEPRDLTFDEAVALLTSEPDRQSGDWYVLERGLFYRDRKYRMGVTCDGMPRKINIPLDRATAIALLTVNGGEQVDWDQVSLWSEPQLDYAKIGMATAFAMLALWPLSAAVWRRIVPQQRTTPDTDVGSV